MATTDTVPARFDVGIEGHGYMIDTQYLEAYRSQTVDPIRRQADSSGSVGEASLNPEAFWRRSPESWHKGAGQRYYDNASSDDERYHWSTGIDPWSEGQLSLLPDTEVLGDFGAAIQEVVASSSFVLWARMSDGTIKSMSTLGVVSTHPSATGVVSIATDGQTLWYVDGSDDLYSTTWTTGATTDSLWVADSPNVSVVSFAGGRLLCQATGGVYDVSATGLTTLPPVLLADNSALNVTASAGGYIYIGSRFNGVIYSTTVKADGSGLEVPTVAVELPRPEVVRQLTSYLGFMLITLDTGVRFAFPANDGSLTVGSSELEAGRNSTDPDPSSGLRKGVRSTAVSRLTHATFGRFMFLAGHQETVVTLDLSTINESFPAYAEGIATAETSSTIAGVFVDATPEQIVVHANGEVFIQNDDFVTAGVLSVGRISFGTNEPKIPVNAQATTDGDVTIDVLSDGVSATADVSGDVDLGGGAALGLQVSLTQASGDPVTTDVVLSSLSLRALPAPSPVDVESVPVLLHDRVSNRQAGNEKVDTDAELTFLKGLRTGGLIDYQNGRRSHRAQVVGVDWVASQRDLPADQWNGTAVVRMKVLP